MSRFLWFPESDSLVIRKTLEKRFCERTAQGCQVRPGNPESYASFTWEGRTYSAHRVAYAVWREAVPTRWLVIHSCNNLGCVNPSHLILNAPGKALTKPVLPMVSPVQAMAFPAESGDQPNRDLEKFAFPGNFREG